MAKRRYQLRRIRLQRSWLDQPCSLRRYLGTSRTCVGTGWHGCLPSRVDRARVRIKNFERATRGTVGSGQVSQGSVGQASAADGGRTHYPKAEVAAPDVRTAAAAIDRAREVLIEVPRPAAQHPRPVTAKLHAVWLFIFVEAPFPDV